MSVKKEGRFLHFTRGEQRMAVEASRVFKVHQHDVRGRWIVVVWHELKVQGLSTNDYSVDFEFKTKAESQEFYDQVMQLIK